MKYYAIADLHGRYDLLDACLAKIDEVASGDYKIITLGDYVDRGPDSAKIIQRLMTEGKRANFISLKGNHEDIMLQTYHQGMYKGWWYSNGGMATDLSYGGEVDPEHLAWVNDLPIYYEAPRHVFVHAGIPTDDPLEEQSHERMMWMLYGKTNHGGWRGKHVVHGHHIHEDGPKRWQRRTALDTGSFFTDRQVIGVFNDSQGRAEEFIEVRHDP